MQLQLKPSEDNKGALVTDYTLYRNEGNQDENWTQIHSYNYATMGYVATISTAEEGMTAGKFYLFLYKATNLNGDSLLSKPV